MVLRAVNIPDGYGGIKAPHRTRSPFAKASGDSVPTKERINLLDG